MKVLELFSGTASFSKAARELGHEAFSVEIEQFFKPDLCKDVNKLLNSDIPFQPDIIWASPPCTTFSVASLRHYWVNGKPKNEKTYQGMLNVAKVFSLIISLQPKFWVIENPRGMLRKQDMMINLPRFTVTYCQYGDTRQKPTDLWTNIKQWNPRKKCCPGDTCHESARRGQSTGTQGRGGGGKFGSMERSMVPHELCLEIIKACETAIQ